VNVEVPDAPTMLVPRTAVPSRNATVPVTGEPPLLETTVVNVTEVPDKEGLLLEISVLAVGCRIV